MRPLLILAILVAGCGNDVSPDKACADAAAALCAQLEMCGAPLITQQFGDVATCQTRSTITCPSTFMAPSTAATPSHLEKCAKAVPSLTCAQLYTRDTPAACAPEPGKLADGSACGDDAQCANAYCKKPAGQVCGVCSKRAAAGAACALDADCDYNLTCANSSCVAYAAAGATCDAGHPCARPNVCKAGVCAAPAQAGQACTPSTGGGDCDLTAGLFCHPTMRTCVAVMWAGAGQPCGFVNNNVVACSGSGHCQVPNLMVMGTCVAPAADGAACDTTNGPDCLPPAECVGGVCKLPNPASCT
jgi:hypothetical protein